MDFFIHDTYVSVPPGVVAVVGVLIALALVVFLARNRE